MDEQIAKITVNLKLSKQYRAGIVAWLHAKAEDIRILDDKKYEDTANWNFYISDNNG